MRLLGKAFFDGLENMIILFYLLCEIEKDYNQVSLTMCELNVYIMIRFAKIL